MKHTLFSERPPVRFGGASWLGIAGLAIMGAGCATHRSDVGLLDRERELLARSWNDSALPGECLLQPAPLAAQASTCEPGVPSTRRGYVAPRDCWGYFPAIYFH